MLLTNKQKNVLTSINDWGVLTVEQIKRNCGITKGYISKILNFLLDRGLIKRMSYGKRMYVYYITKTGSLYVGKIGRGYTSSNKEPNLLMLKHTLLLSDVCWYYQNFYSQKGFSYSYKSEREIYSEQLLNSQISTRERRDLRYTLPDFVFTLEKEGIVKYRTAVELELTPKNFKRWEKKLSKYKKEIEQGKYTNVLYVTDDPSTEHRLRAVSKKVEIQLNFASLETIQEQI